MTNYDKNDAIPKGVEVKGMVDPDGNPARGRWVADHSTPLKPRTLMVERFIDEGPELREWDIWVEQREGVGEAEKLNDKPYKCATFFAAVEKYLWAGGVPVRPVAPDGRRPKEFFHHEAGAWHKLSFEHPEDKLGRRLWPTEAQARGLKIWDLWAEGSESPDGQRETASQLSTTHIVADSFDKAVSEHIRDLEDTEAVLYAKDDEKNVWTYRGRKLHPTESRARVAFG